MNQAGSRSVIPPFQAQPPSIQSPQIQILGSQFNQNEYQRQTMQPPQYQSQVINQNTNSNNQAPSLYVTQKIQYQLQGQSNGNLKYVQSPEQRQTSQVLMSNGSTSSINSNFNYQQQQFKLKSIIHGSNYQNSQQQSVPQTRNRFMSVIPSNLQHPSTPTQYQQPQESGRYLSSNSNNYYNNNNFNTSNLTQQIPNNQVNNNNNFANLGNSNGFVIYNQHFNQSQMQNSSANLTGGVSYGQSLSPNSQYPTSSSMKDPINETILKHEKMLKEILQSKNLKIARDQNIDLCQSQGGNMYLPAQGEPEQYQRVYVVNNKIKLSPKKTVLKTRINFHNQPLLKQQYTISQKQSPASRSSSESKQSVTHIIRHPQFVQELRVNDRQVPIVNSERPIEKDQMRGNDLKNSASSVIIQSPVNIKGFYDSQQNKNLPSYLSSPPTYENSLQNPVSQGQNPYVNPNQHYEKIISTPQNQKSELKYAPQFNYFPQDKLKQENITDDSPILTFVPSNYAPQDKLKQENQTNDSPILTFVPPDDGLSQKNSYKSEFTLNPQDSKNKGSTPPPSISKSAYPTYEKEYIPIELSGRNEIGSQSTPNKKEKYSNNTYSQNYPNQISQNKAAADYPNQNKYIQITELSNPQTTSAVKQNQQVELNQNPFSNNPVNTVYYFNQTLPANQSQKNEKLSAASPNGQIDDNPQIQTKYIQEIPFTVSPQQNNASNIQYAQPITNSPQVQPNQTIQAQLQKDNQTQPFQQSPQKNPLLAIPPYTPLLYPSYQGIEDPLFNLGLVSQRTFLSRQPSREKLQEKPRQSSYSPTKTMQSEIGKPMYTQNPYTVIEQQINQLKNQNGRQNTQEQPRNTSLSPNPSIFSDQGKSITPISFSQNLQISQQEAQKPLIAKTQPPIISNTITSSPEGIRTQKIQIMHTTQIPLAGGLQLNTQVTTEHEVKDVPLYLKNSFQDDIREMDNQQFLQNSFAQNQNKQFTFQTFSSPFPQTSLHLQSFSNPNLQQSNIQPNYFLNSPLRNQFDQNNNSSSLKQQDLQKIIGQFDSEGDQYQDIIDQIGQQQKQETDKEAFINLQKVQVNPQTQQTQDKLQSQQLNEYIGRAKTPSRHSELSQAQNIYISDPVLQNEPTQYQETKKSPLVVDQKKDTSFSSVKVQTANKKTSENPTQEKMIEENIDKLIGNIFKEAINNVNENISNKRNELDQQEQSQKLEQQEKQKTQSEENLQNSSQQQPDFQQDYIVSNEQLSNILKSRSNSSVISRNSNLIPQDNAVIDRASNDFVIQQPDEVEKERVKCTSKTPRNQSLEDQIKLKEMIENNQQVNQQKQVAQPAKNLNTIDEIEHDLSVFKKIENGNTFHIPMSEEQKKELAQSWQKSDYLQQLILDQLNQEKKQLKQASKANLQNSLTQFSKPINRNSSQSFSQMQQSDSFNFQQSQLQKSREGSISLDKKNDANLEFLRVKRNSSNSQNKRQYQETPSTEKPFQNSSKQIKVQTNYPPNQIAKQKLTSLLNQQSPQQQQDKVFPFFQPVQSRNKSPSLTNPLLNSKQASAEKQRSIVDKIENTFEDAQPMEDKAVFSFQQYNSDKKMKNVLSVAQFQQPYPSMQQNEGLQNSPRNQLQQSIAECQEENRIDEPQYLSQNPQQYPTNANFNQGPDIILVPNYLESEKDKKYRDFLLKMLNNYKEKREEILKKIEKLNLKQQNEHQQQPENIVSRPNQQYPSKSKEQRNKDSDRHRNFRSRNNSNTMQMNESELSQSKKKFDVNNFMGDAFSENEQGDQIQQYEILRNNDPGSPANAKRNLEALMQSINNSPEENYDQIKKRANNKNTFKTNREEFDPQNYIQSISKGRKLRACELQHIMDEKEKSSSPQKNPSINYEYYRAAQFKESPKKSKSPLSTKQSDRPHSPHSNVKSQTTAASRQMAVKSQNKNDRDQIQTLQNQQKSQVQQKSFTNKSISPIRQVVPIKSELKTQNSRVGQDKERKLDSQVNQKLNVSQRNSKLDQSQNNKSTNEESKKRSMKQASNNQQRNQVEQTQASKRKICVKSQTYQFEDQESEDLDPYSQSDNIIPLLNQPSRELQNLKIQDQNTIESYHYNTSKEVPRNIQPSDINQQNFSKPTSSHINKIKSKPAVQSQKSSPATSKSPRDQRQQQPIKQNQPLKANSYLKNPSKASQNQKKTDNISNPSHGNKQIIKSINDMQKYSEYMVANNQNLLKELEQSMENSHGMSSSQLNKSRNHSNSLGRSIIKEIGSFFKYQQDQERSPRSRRANESLSRSRGYQQDIDLTRNENESSPERNQSDQYDEIKHRSSNPNTNNLYVQIRKTIHSISPPNSKDQKKGNYFNLPQYTSNNVLDQRSFSDINQSRGQSDSSPYQNNQQQINLSQIKNIITKNNQKIQKNIQK